MNDTAFYNNPNAINTFRMAGLFLFGGFVISVITFTLYLVGMVVYTDFIHHNPNRTYLETLQVLYLSPLMGIFFSLWHMPLALIAGAILAGLG